MYVANKLVEQYNRGDEEVRNNDFACPCVANNLGYVATVEPQNADTVGTYRKLVS